jgi:hypothetical protein
LNRAALGESETVVQWLRHRIGLSVDASPSAEEDR